MAERYQIRGKISQGGFGSVYKAWDTQLEREVAIKRLLPPEESVAYDAKLILKEAGFLSKLQHPNIVTVYDLGEDDDGAYLVMEYVDGLNLTEYTAQQVMSIAHFRVFAPQCLEALMAAQSLNVMHRDIKPANIMIRFLPSGMPQAKLLDFGLAKFSALPSLQTVNHGNILGSVFFMAPEQFERQPLDMRTDLYALGCVFYYTLTGHRPFEGGTMVEVLDRHLNHEYIPVQHHRPELPEVLANWVMHLMNRYPDDRPQSPEAAFQEWQVVEMWLKTMKLEPVPSFASAHNIPPPAVAQGRVLQPNMGRITGPLGPPGPNRHTTSVPRVTRRVGPNGMPTATRRYGPNGMPTVTRRVGPEGVSTDTRRYAPGTTARYVIPQAPTETERLPWAKITALLGSLIILSGILYVFWPQKPVRPGTTPESAKDPSGTGPAAELRDTAWQQAELPKDVAAYFPFDQYGVSSLTIMNQISGKNYPRNAAMVVPSFFPNFGDALKFTESSEKWVATDKMEWAARAPGFTVAMWLQPAAETSGSRQFMTMLAFPGADFSRSRVLLGLANDNVNGTEVHNVPRFGIRTNDEENSWVDKRAVNHPMKINEANHLAATVDYSAGKILLFVNGNKVEEFTEDRQKTSTGLSPSTVPSALALGNLADGGQGRYNEPYTGMIDDVLIFRRALDQDEVKKLAEKTRKK